MLCGSLTSMPKAGKKLEKTVKALEELLSGSALKVTSPAKLPDYDSGGYREVDISIEGRVGSHNILIAIECRDHQKRQNKTWIEQLRTKKEAIRAHKMIAVSTSGFSEGAKQTAQKYGIETRLISNLDSKELADTLPHIEVVYILNKFEVKGVRSTRIDSSDLEDVDPKSLSIGGSGTQQHKTEDKVFIDRNTGKRFSINDLVANIKFPNGISLFDRIPPNQAPVEGIVHLDLGNSSNVLLAEFNDRIYRMVEMDIELRLWKIENTVPISAALQYTSDEEILADRIEYKFNEKDGKEITVSFQQDKQTLAGNISVDII